MKEKEGTEAEADLSSMIGGISLLVAQREELLVRSKKELLEFLELSDEYDASEILQKLEGNDFLEERAVRTLAGIDA